MSMDARILMRAFARALAPPRLPRLRSSVRGGPGAAAAVLGGRPRNGRLPGFRPYRAVRRRGWRRRAGRDRSSPSLGEDMLLAWSRRASPQRMTTTLMRGLVLTL